ncbi:LOW QUALITY PROTEIN: galactosylceramide sulfotransferase-like [Paramacrobiotus metropolitanus]|uniref:LOW QUALITY PROTEIN: galactosylceramide sulfotransferase-like n=1 Tax=Paramacrobiotus metropolitanus TaxID=2943436 RepID=UPI002445CA19|nr:LOW QUALITY PROTEIN: galactosylceramide sulfotransferase-like [Paramacrobiotus metropolitanus]
MRRRAGCWECYSPRSTNGDLVKLTLLVGLLTFSFSAYFILGGPGLDRLLPRERIFLKTVCPDAFLQIKSEELEIKLPDHRLQAIRPPLDEPTTAAARKPVGHCSPHHNIVFLKVHKCASSAFQNILLRFGESNNLTLVLPPKDNYLGHREKFAPELAIPLPSALGSQYNLLCHHTRFHRENIESIMPNDTVYVTSLKEPAAMFESAYDFFGLVKGMALTSPISSNGRNIITTTRLLIRSRFARNPMMFDFGLEMEDFQDQSKIEEKIAELNDRFSLVMITEEMDESLVMLRDLLCWSWNDVVTFRVNKRRDSRVVPLTRTMKKKIRAWNNADDQLYRHFTRSSSGRKKSTDCSVYRKMWPNCGR